MADDSHKRSGVKAAVGVFIVMILMGGGWLYYAKSEVITAPLSLRFAYLPAGLTIIGTPPKVEAKVKAPARLARELALPLIHIVDLAGAKKGRHVITLTPGEMAVSQGVKVLEINPTSFTIEMDRQGEKSVPVVADLLNEPVPGYVVSTVVTTPSTVQIIGPARFIEEITAIRTTPVDLSGMMESAKKTVALNLGDGLSVTPEEDRLVRVEIDIDEEVIEQLISLPIQCDSTHRCIVRPERIHVLVKGPKNTVAKLSQGIGISVSVDLTELGPGVYSRPAVISPPLNTTIVKAEPMVFTIELRE